jgi:hypothetical protein
MLEWKCCGLVIVELWQKRFKKSVVGSDTCGGYPCFFFAAVDPEEARIVYEPEPSTMQKRCKITRCVYENDSHSTGFSGGLMVLRR